MRLSCDYPSTVAQRVADKVIKAGIPYGTELVFDAKDALVSATNSIERILWRRIHKQMVNTCNKANGVACVTAHYLQTHYTSKRPDAFFANYSSLALPKSFYASSSSVSRGQGVCDFTRVYSGAVQWP